MSHVVPGVGSSPAAAADGSPAGWTQRGEVHVRPDLLGSAAGRRVAAHESVHAAQQRGAGGRTGTPAELEGEAARGADAVLAGRPFAPSLRAPPTARLGFGEPWLPEPTATAEREAAELTGAGFDPNRTEIHVATGSTGSAGGGPAQVDYRISVRSTGSRGSITSTSEVTVRYDPDATVDLISGPQIRALSPETGLYPSRTVPAYPYTVSYRRHVTYTDVEGRQADLAVDGVVHLSAARWAQEVGSAPAPSFESLLALRGEHAEASFQLAGTGPVTSYLRTGAARGEGSLAGLLVMVSAGSASGPSTSTSGPGVWFIGPTVTAADQHAGIRAVLAAEDLRVLVERLVSSGATDSRGLLEEALDTLAGWLSPVSEFLDTLGEDIWDALPNWLKEELVEFGRAAAELAAALGDLVSGLAGAIGEWWDELPPWARGVLTAVGYFVGGFAAIAALAGLVVLATEGAVAFGTAMLVVGGIALVYGFASSAISRTQEAWAAGDWAALLDVPMVALMDVVGVSGIYEGVTNTSILTARPLNLSEEERWERGTSGGLQLVTLVLGARGMRGGRVPPRLEPAEVTFTGPRAGFDALAPDYLPRNLPEGYAWRRTGSTWELVRDPSAVDRPVEISTFDDGTGRPSYVVRVDGLPMNAESFTRPPGDLYSGPQRLPENLRGTGVDNPYRTPDGRVYDKGHGIDFADTPEGPGVRSSTLAPENFTPQAAWWNRWVRNQLVQRIRASGNTYRELAIYDTPPPRTVSGAAIPREFVFMEVGPGGRPVAAWRVPNDPALPHRTLAALPQYQLPPGRIPAVMLAADGTALPAGTRVGRTAIIGPPPSGDREREGSP